jgi:hypothetical protein
MAESYASPSCCLEGALRQEHQVVGQSKKADPQGHRVDLPGGSGVGSASYRPPISLPHDGPRPDSVSSTKGWSLEPWKEACRLSRAQC